MDTMARFPPRVPPLGSGYAKVYCRCAITRNHPLSATRAPITSIRTLVHVLTYNNIQQCKYHGPFCCLRGRNKSLLPSKSARIECPSEYVGSHAKRSGKAGEISLAPGAMRRISPSNLREARGIQARTRRDGDAIPPKRGARWAEGGRNVTSTPRGRALMPARHPPESVLLPARTRVLTGAMPAERSGKTTRTPRYPSGNPPESARKRSGTPGRTCVMPRAKGRRRASHARMQK